MDPNPTDRCVISISFIINILKERLQGWADLKAPGTAPASPNDSRLRRSFRESGQPQKRAGLFDSLAAAGAVDDAQGPTIKSQRRRSFAAGHFPMILPIVKYGDSVLHRVAEPVTAFDQALERLSRDMVETMYAAPGVGLAAPQVGVLTRLMVIDPTAGEKAGSLIVLANPEIQESEGDQYEEEGCLSIPEFTARVHRPEKLIVSGKRIDGSRIVVEGEELMARILSHEIDHLNGVLFIDHLSVIKRDIIKRKIRKKVRAGEW